MAGFAIGPPESRGTQPQHKRLPQRLSAPVLVRIASLHFPFREYKRIEFGADQHHYRDDIQPYQQRNYCR